MNPDLEAALAELRSHLGERLSTQAAVREQHGQGEDDHGCQPPDAVAYPLCNEEVALIARICHRHRIPIIPYGTGTSVEGHLLALEGGVSIDLSRMDGILEINPADMDCRVQAGVCRQRLNQALRHQGLFFPVDPGADASLGGMAATAASGTNAVRYGTMGDNVLGLTLVTADGQIIRTGTRARKTAAGYNLTQLLVGSEGTLGIITEVCLRLHPVPECIRASVCQFDSLDGAVNTVIEALTSGADLARIELLNGLQMQASIQYSKLPGFEPRPTLFLEFHGSPATVREQVQLLEAISQQHGGSDFIWAERSEERNNLWRARHQAYYAALALRPGCRGFPTDVCVPISRLADSLLDAEAKAESLGLACPIVGHVGDGNYHVLILYRAEDSEERARARELSRHIVQTALALEGTCSGEHGIGSGKKGFLLDEQGDAVGLMRQVKQALDPRGILNPGKIFDPAP